MDEKLDIKTAIKDTLPTVFGYIGIGLAFGIVGKAAGFHPLVVTLMSLLIGTLLTDESFALGMNKLNYTGQKLNFRWMNTANWISYLTWVGSSLVGALLGNFITDPKKFGLDFAIVAMFIGLLYLQVISDRNTSKRLQLILIGLTLILVYVGLIFIPSNLVIVVVTLIGCGLGVWIKHAFF